MKIAVVFWGITRSLKYTINSIEENVLNQLSDHKVDIILHSYKLNTLYKNKRANEPEHYLDRKICNTMWLQQLC